MIYLYSLLMGIVAYTLRAWSRGFKISAPPDSITYRAMANGTPVPDPFRLRWLIPMIMRTQDLLLWQIMDGASLILTTPLISWLAVLHGVDPLFAAALWVSLPLWDILSKLTGMIDPPALLVALMAACLHFSGHYTSALITAIIGAMMAPKVPVFIILWTCSLRYLPAFLPILGAYALAPKGEPLIHPEAINHPWRSSMMKNGSFLHNIREIVLPWGAVLASIIDFPLLYLPLVLVAYSQLFRALDRARLFMWAAPILIILALRIIPENLLFLSILLTWFNPYRPEV